MLELRRGFGAVSHFGRVGEVGELLGLEEEGVAEEKDLELSFLAESVRKVLSRRLSVSMTPDP